MSEEKDLPEEREVRSLSPSEEGVLGSVGEGIGSSIVGMESLVFFVGERLLVFFKYGVIEGRVAYRLVLDNRFHIHPSIVIKFRIARLFGCHCICTTHAPLRRYRQPPLLQVSETCPVLRHRREAALERAAGHRSALQTRPNIGRKRRPERVAATWEHTPAPTFACRQLPASRQRANARHSRRLSVRRMARP